MEAYESLMLIHILDHLLILSINDPFCLLPPIILDVPRWAPPLPFAHRPPVAPGQRKPPEVAPSLAKNDAALAGEETEPLPVKKLVVEPSTIRI